MKRTPLVALFLSAAWLLGPAGCAKKQIITGSDPADLSRAGATPQISRSKEAGSHASISSLGPPSAAGAIPERPAPSRAATHPPPGTGATEPTPERSATAHARDPKAQGGLSRVHFGFDQSTLSPEARRILAKDAEYLKSNQGARITIEGHCDERGTTGYNLALGEKRGNAVYQYLMDLGVDPNRMRFISYGREIPLDPAHEERAWAKNRRAELVQVE